MDIMIENNPFKKLLFSNSKDVQVSLNYIIQIYSEITSGRVLDGELLHTEILEVNLFAFADRLFMKISHDEICIKQSVGKYKYIN